MSLTPEQAAFKRDVYRHWRDNQIPLEQIAETVGISPQRLKMFVDGALPTLTDEERAALAPLEDQFVEAEDADTRDYRLRNLGFPPRTARTIFQEHAKK